MCACIFNLPFMCKVTPPSAAHVWVQNFYKFCPLDNFLQVSMQPLVQCSLIKQSMVWQVHMTPAVGALFTIGGFARIHSKIQSTKTKRTSKYFSHSSSSSYSTSPHCLLTKLCARGRPLKSPPIDATSTSH